YLSYASAAENTVQENWECYTAPTPGLLGAKILNDVDLNVLREYIDWKPFFISWELHGNFPAILEDEKVGVEATKLYKDANAMLDQIIAEKWLTARGSIGFWPAARTAADSVSVKAESKTIQLEFLRQQIKKAADQPNLSLADFIKPGTD